MKIELQLVIWSIENLYVLELVGMKECAVVEYEDILLDFEEVVEQLILSFQTRKMDSDECLQLWEVVLQKLAIVVKP